MTNRIQNEKPYRNRWLGETWNISRLLVKSILSNRQMLRLRPSLLLFLVRYMGKFHLKNLDGQLILHSHLPAVNSKAFTRFINEHLLDGVRGPSHAQIGLTNVCPQNCAFCYNKKRSGTLMTTEEIIELIGALKRMGVFWLGFTGGEPLMNQDLPGIIKSAGDDCALKLFTTGEGITKEGAAELRKAGLLYVSVSMDHWEEALHDRGRGRKGAFRSAVRAIKIFRKAGLHVSVSSVISSEMMHKGQVHKLLRFLVRLGVHEAWLSEVKPVNEDRWDQRKVFSETDRRKLIRLQDICNKGKRITVNYLGHFEDGKHFGCNAGNKMIYIDAFGEISPCVFVPMSFGNIRNGPVREVAEEMRSYFPSARTCFINQNCELLKKYSKGSIPLEREESIALMQEVLPGPPAAFWQVSRQRSL